MSTLLKSFLVLYCIFHVTLALEVLHTDIQQDGIDKVMLNEIKATQMTRANANRLFRQLYDPLFVKGQEQDSPKYRLLRGFAYTQWCLNFAKWWIWENTDRIKKLNMWEEVRTQCHTECAVDRGQYLVSEVKCMKCVFDHENDGNSAGRFDLDFNLHNNFTNYNVSKISKLNQLFLYVSCWGRIVRGTRRDENENSDDDQSWKVVFTNPNQSNKEEYEAFKVAKFNKDQDITKAWGTEHEDVYMQKKGRFYFDPSETPRRWHEWTSQSRYADGQLVDKMATQEIGSAGGATCTCPGGNKYVVGALVNPAESSHLELNNELNYSESCKDGLIDWGTVNEAAHDETNLELSTYGLRAVHCNVSGWPLDYHAQHAECDGLTEEQKQACLQQVYYNAYNNKSQGWFYLSAAKFNAYKHYKAKTNGALSPCMYLHNRMTRFENGVEVGITSDDVNWFTQTNGDLFTEYDWWQHKNDGWLDACLDVLKRQASDMCQFDVPWSNGNWHGLDHERDATRLAQMDQLQVAYKDHLQGHCRRVRDTTGACTDDLAHWTQMCTNAHAAELVIDQIAILGVGCPLPKPQYVKPPPKPCWFDGEHNCPDPVLPRCDMVAREMENISGQVKLTSEMARCFSHNLTANTLESKLRYYCVARGVWEAKGDRTLRELESQEWEKRRLVHYMGEAQYHFNDDAADKPAYLQRIKKQLHKLKREEEAAEELDWWNGSVGIATPVPESGGSDVNVPLN